MDPKLGPLGMRPVELMANRDVPSRTDGAASMGEAFEAILLQQLFVSMRETVPKSGLFEGSSADGLYDHLVEQAMGEHLARSGGIGLAPLFDEAPATGQIEKVGRAFAWQGSAGVAPIGRPGDESVRIDFTHGRPLADDLPPQDDPWLDQPDAASRLQTLLGGDEP